MWEERYLNKDAEEGPELDRAKGHAQDVLRAKISFKKKNHSEIVEIKDQEKKHKMR